jgi:hypothetical protein
MEYKYPGTNYLNKRRENIMKHNKPVFEDLELKEKLAKQQLSRSDKTIYEQAKLLNDIETLKQYEKQTQQDDSIDSIASAVKFMKENNHSNESITDALSKLSDLTFEQSPIYQQIRKQIEKGLFKYNTPVKEEHYSVKGWLQHQRDELTDGLVYTTILDMKIAKVVELLEKALEPNDVIEKDQLIVKVLKILTDGRDK